MKRKPIAKRVKVLASIIIVLLTSASIWQHQQVASLVKLLSPKHNLSEPVVAIRKTLLSAPQVQDESLLISEVPVIPQTFISRIPAWYFAAERQVVQPSPLKRVIDKVLDDENDDSLVVMDKVVVIPRTLRKSLG